MGTCVGGKVSLIWIENDGGEGRRAFASAISVRYRAPLGLVGLCVTTRFAGVEGKDPGVCPFFFLSFCTVFLLLALVRVTAVRVTPNTHVSHQRNQKG